MLGFFVGGAAALLFRRRGLLALALGGGLFLAAFALAFLGKWFGYFLVAYWLRLDLPALFPWLPLGEGLLSLAFFWPLRPKAREEPKA